VFADLLEAKVLIEDYRDHYNQQRPHSALGYLSPAQFVAAADLGAKEENTGKPEELESVLIPFRFVSGIMGACQRYSTRR
jgi:Integrase core domain